MTQDVINEQMGLTKLVIPRAAKNQLLKFHCSNVILLGVWTADTSKQQANLEIGRKIKEQLGIHGKIGFQLHRDTMVKHSSATKNLYTV